MESSTSSGKISRTIGTQTSERHLGSGKRVQHLLPGIPDEITLEKICTKLPWRAFKILSLVSPTWQMAIESGQVYNARVRARSTETLLVHPHFHDFHDSRIALYSRIDECCYELPPIPHLGERVPESCECIGLNGKIYVLGGERLGSNDGSADVFVLDVAGGRDWKQCASMQEPKLGFGCGISGGKIYVFGGSSGISDPMPMRGSEVYDPKVDAWSPIMPMPSWRCDHSVAAVGEELFAYSGQVYNPDVFKFDANGRVVGDPYDWDVDDDTERLLDASSLDVYHPAKNEWRVVENVDMSLHDVVFMAKGKFHSMSDFRIDVYDIDKESWIKRHRNFFPQFDQDCHPVYLRSAVAVDNDLFATKLVIRHRNRNRIRRSICLFHSRGFSSGTGEIVWQKTSCCRAYDHFTALCPIKL